MKNDLDEIKRLCEDLYSHIDFERLSESDKNLIVAWNKICNIPGFLRKSKIKQTRPWLDYVKEVYNAALTGKPMPAELKGDIVDCVNNSEEKYLPITTHRPGAYITPTTKANNIIFDTTKNTAIYECLREVAVEKSRSKKEINVLISLQYTEEDKALDSKINRFDREVYDAITTQFINGQNDYITDNMIAFVLSGGDKSKKNTFSEKLKKAINDSVYKLWHTDFNLDFTEQAKAYHMNIEDCKYKGPLLACEQVEMKLNGEVITTYHIIRKPILYEYANHLGQVMQIDLNRLAIEGLENTPENILIKNYLNRRIEIMKNKNNSVTSNIIRYKAIYELIDFDGNKVEAKRIRDKVKKCLDEFIKLGIIKSYEEIKEGREIAKIKILF